MMMIIYLDLLVLLNTGVNTLILMGVNRIVKRQVPVWRIIAAGITGTMLLLLILIFAAPGYWWWALTIISPFIMAAVIYYPLAWMDVFRNGVLITLAAFLVGGILTATESFPFILNEQIYGQWFLIIAVLLTLHGMVWVMQPYLEDRHWQGFMKTEIGVSYRNNYHQIAAYLDTGNRLRDPFSKKPVIIVSLSSMQKVLPDYLCQLLNIKNGDLVSVIGGIEDPFLAKRVYLIPYNGVEGETSMLLGFRPDAVTITRKGESWEVSNQVALGIHNGGNFFANEYQALLPPEVLQFVS